MFSRSLLGLVAIFALFATRRKLKEDLLRRLPITALSRINTLVTFYMAGFILSAVTFLVCYIIFAVGLLKANRHARMGTLILAGLTVCLGPLSLVLPGTPFTRGVNIAGAVLASVIILLLLMREKSFTLDKDG